MDIQPLLSPSGNAVFSVGGKHAWKTDSYRGFNVSLEWVSKVGKRKNPPRVLCIWRAGNVLSPSNENDGIWTISANGSMFFVGFDEKTGKCNGSVNQSAMKEVAEGLRVIGYSAMDTYQMHALCDVLVRYLPELAKMPPAPRHVRNSLAGTPFFDVQHIHRDSGRVISEGEV